MKEQFTRKRIIKSAEDLFAAFDFSDVSMRAISNSARVNISSIYYYYHSKEALLEHILKATEQLIILHLPCNQKMDNPIDQLVRFTSDFLSRLLGDSNLILIFLKARNGNIEAGLRGYIDRIEAMIASALDTLLDQCRRSGVITLAIPNQIIINVFFIMMSEAARYKRRYLLANPDGSGQEALLAAQLHQLRQPIEALFRYILV
ncbi:TetR/AcrR family transcriptional regulator [Chitinophaga sancti]|uniref:TetR/AcrR family transcriptional regulator n=1 Tax=Chitinophaga sancti TaxID=1004 RepID=A0A1K1T073_9BACT|nr:TetR/AcrR family transcriptional regulator [Chitinophaga sancti]WQD62303.1 TetR/AcrR family transcriptional regulator [Chitinophaga sancti]WQG92128.1 TetR/AcrR family transcriptional regulator [Chitinophaga sancti]SFW89509.1 transcriptional regulator, TetR family [Chitinophaga sancti]